MNYHELRSCPTALDSGNRHAKLGRMQVKATYNCQKTTDNFGNCQSFCVKSRIFAGFWLGEGVAARQSLGIVHKPHPYPSPLGSLLKKTITAKSRETKREKMRTFLEYNLKYCENNRKFIRIQV